MPSEREWLMNVGRLSEQGDFLGAYDEAMDIVEQYPDSLGAKIYAVLSLVKAGLATKAYEHYTNPAWGLAAQDDRTLASLAGILAWNRAELRLARLTQEQERSLSGPPIPRAEPVPRMTTVQCAARLYPRAFEDLATIGAIVSREMAWRARNGLDRLRHATQAADIYLKVYAETNGITPGINAATMTLLSSDASGAVATVRRVKHDNRSTGTSPADRPESGSSDDGHRTDQSPSPEDKYLPWDERPSLEMVSPLLCGDDDFEVKVAALIRKYQEKPSGNLYERSVIALHIQSVLDHLHGNLAGVKPDCEEERGGYAALRKQLIPPSIIHYAGHLVSVPGAPTRFDRTSMTAVQKLIKDRLREHQVGAGYGSLACGADLLFAAALIDRQAELHVVLPFGKEEFIDSSVRPGGEDWTDLFHYCWDRATSTTIVTSDEFLGDTELYELGSGVAMGLAIRRHQATRLPVRQFLVSSDVQETGQAPRADGTPNFLRKMAMDWMKYCDAIKQPEFAQVITIPCDRGADFATPRAIKHGQGRGRRVKAMLFSDVEGFSGLQEKQIPVFQSLVLEGTVKALREHARHIGGKPKADPIEFLNTWGDAYYMVFDSVVTAAECALLMQERMKRTNFAAEGLPKELKMRIGMHVGPAYQGLDVATGNPTWYGSQVSKAARIEPVAKAGEIYVSEAFACLLALQGSQKYECEYVGRKPSAKNYGPMRMFRLQRRMDFSVLGGAPKAADIPQPLTQE
jgi:class 3 adenylate cyclase